MSKQKQTKRNNKLNPNPEQKQKVDKNASSSPTLYNWIILGMYSLLVLTGTVKHEMWRDELQAFLFARDSASILEMFGQMQYEGHPALWHTLLYMVAKTVKDPFYMQILHALIAIGAGYLVAIKSPFNNTTKILFLAGYFPLFEYSLISRNYALGMLCLFAALYFLFNSNKQKTSGAFMLVLLANSSIYGLLLAGMVTITFLYQEFKTIKHFSKQHYAFITITVLGAILSIYQIAPKPGGNNYIMWANGLELDRVKFAFSDIIKAYFPIPSFKNQAFWNENFFIPAPLNVSGTAFFFSLISVLLIALTLRKNTTALLFYIGATLGIITLTYITFLPYMRYLGHLILTLAGAYWMYLKGAQTTSTNYGFNLKTFITIILVFNVVGGVYAWKSEIKQAFSTARETADYLEKKQLKNSEIAVFPDYCGAGISGYLNKKLFYPQTNQTGSYVVWNNKRKHTMNIGEALTLTEQRAVKLNKDHVFISNSQLEINYNDGRKEALMDYYFPDSTHLFLTASFPNAICGDDVFYVYTLLPKKHTTIKN